MRQRTYGGVGSPAREGGLTRFHFLYMIIGLEKSSINTLPR